MAVIKPIDLSRVYDLRRTVRYRVSPLFEMAVSLRQAALPGGPADDWVEKARDSIRQEGLESELLYFSSAFSRDVPAFFRPQTVERLSDPDGSYAYIAGLPASQFVQALTEVMGEDARALPLWQDLAHNPQLVKGRFTLFISAYLRLVFEPIWEQLQPAYLGEIERRNHQLSTYEEVETFVASLLAQPHADLDAEDRCVILHPSWFHREQPLCFDAGKHLHIVYPLPRSGTHI